MVNEDICKDLPELILGFSIEKITVDKEKSIVYHPEYKGVRLDITAADENHTHYNIEMQVRRKKNLDAEAFTTMLSEKQTDETMRYLRWIILGRRNRYYHSQIDVELLLTGLKYEELPDSYVIFICNFDPFGSGKYQYTFETVCREDPSICLDDGKHSIFLNTRGKNKAEVSEGLVIFWNMLSQVTVILTQPAGMTLLIVFRKRKA